MNYDKKMENEIYSCTNTGSMKIRDGVSSEELLIEENDLRKFVSDIEHAPEWRDISVTEFIERIGAVIAVLDENLNKSTSEKLQGQLLRSILHLTKISYSHEFGHLPYCDVGPDEMSKLLSMNEKRLRRHEDSRAFFARFIRKIFQRVRRI